MKRLALLSLAALMLAATAFAPVAMAQELGDVEVQSATLGTGGTAVLTGTIQCTEGWQYRVYAELRQTTGNRPYNFGFDAYPDQGGPYATCQTTGPETFTITVAGERPYKKGAALVRTTAEVCEPSFSFCQSARSDFQELKIR
jgi:hypothetical protein